MVYDPERHEALCDEAWAPERARAQIERIAADFDATRRADDSWPSHPLDEARVDPRWTLYFGAAGVVVALRILRREGYTAVDGSGALPRIHRAYLASPDVGHELGLQIGEIGILTPAVLADPSDAQSARRLDQCMTEIVGHPAREITAGETGMLHAAWSLYEVTGDERWNDHFCRGADSLWNHWTHHAERDEWVWENRIFGSMRAYYGACHGVAGNARALLRGASALPADWPAIIAERCVNTLEAAALTDGADINWPVSGDASGTRRLVQWCHGAPGVVSALAPFPRVDSACSARLDALLARAGEFVWKAGPLAKGPGICHGTAGNGYAFLALYRRTGMAEWLERARRFAMHAIEQCESARLRYGQLRYSLWTGDGGLAVYLHHCLHPERAMLPGLELF